MRSVKRTLSFLACLLGSWDAANADPPLDSHRAFLRHYCFECHGAEKQKGDHRFDTLGNDLGDLLTLETWQGILDQLNLGEMPPKKAVQPPYEETAKVIEGLTPVLRDAYAARKSTGGQAVIRRLNKFELRNTLRDLFYINHPDFEPGVVSGLYDFNGNGITAQKTIEPTRSFQDDEEAEGFDTIGDALVMSDFLLMMLIGAAEETIEMATHNEPQKPFEAETFTAPISTKTLHGDTLGKYQREKGDPYDEVFQRWDRYNRIDPDRYHGGMRRPDRYRITVEISAHNPKEDTWGNWTVREGGLVHHGRQSLEEPFEVGLYLQRFEHLRGERKHRVTSWSLPGDGKKRTFSFETWIDEPWSAWVGWENGPWIQHNAFHILLEQWYPEEYEKIDRKQKGFKKEVAEVLFRKGYLGPTLRVPQLPDRSRWRRVAAEEPHRALWKRHDRRGGHQEPLPSLRRAGLPAAGCTGGSGPVRGACGAAGRRRSLAPGRHEGGATQRSCVPPTLSTCGKSPGGWMTSRSPHGSATFFGRRCPTSRS